MANVILVNDNDIQIGQMEKLKAHQLGSLHRAFSVFIFNNRGDLLLQKRARGKYQSGGLWTNTCCSHPVSKDIQKEAEKRLKKEMAIKCSLQKIFCFTYTAKVGDLIENELDYVFIGFYNGNVKPNKKEAEDYKWLNFEDLKNNITRNPENYTEWFKLIYEKVFRYANLAKMGR